MPVLTPEQRIKYLQTVWYEFQKKAKTRRDWSSKEYQVAYRWLSRGLPLAVVLRGFNDFNGVPRRLEALERSVDEAAEYHFKAVGVLTELPEPGPLESPEVQK